MTDENSEELKNPYVRLERLSLENINDYKPKPEANGYYLIHSSPEELNYPNETNNMLSLDIMSQLLNDNGRLFRSYVLLERLSPHDIENLLTKKD